MSLLRTVSLFVIGVLLGAAVIAPGRVAAEVPLEDRLRSIVTAEKGGTFGVVIVDLANGNGVYSQNPDLTLKPASVLKIVTAAAALELLGPEYTFRTEFWVNHPVPGGVETLTVVGGGDPDLTTEGGWLVARELHKRGIRRIGSIVLDESHFASLRPASGQRAYRAGSAGLSFNFNSIGFKICPTSPGKNAVVSVDPWESGATISGNVRTGKGGGLTVDQKGSGLRYVLGGFVPPGECVSVYRSVPDPAGYFGRTFVELLRGVGVQVLRGAAPGRKSAGARLMYEHASKPLVDIVRDLNHFSNNFIAEQLLLALGEVPGGGRDRQVGLDRLSRYLVNLGVPSEQVSLADASGLSHTNRLTPRAIVTVLRRMARSVEVGPEFEISLSVSGRNGTLRRRDFGGGESPTVRAKTGTLDGVSSLAGYLSGRSGKRYAFAIIGNGLASKARALKLEERLVETLYEAG
ncbi:MAG: hypothetical protein RL417_1354 [Pseudomonadota bacterium]|jgi:D-alanyl-D-alanine carboxypeptidase/D-alanyl-D-alanine-endopeptidase (penicillin-binding protein 4)